MTDADVPLVILTKLMAPLIGRKTHYFTCSPGVTVKLAGF